MLQHTTTHCSRCESKFSYSSRGFSATHRTATHRDLLQHTATYGNTLQLIETHCINRCDDFYAYSCGGFLEKTVLAPDQLGFANSWDGVQVHFPLQHSAPLCTTLQHYVTRCNVLQHSTNFCSTLQHSTTLRNNPQHSATLCNTMLCDGIGVCTTLQHCTARCSTLQHAATPLQRTVQHTATLCNILQHSGTPSQDGV